MTVSHTELRPAAERVQAYLQSAHPEALGFLFGRLLKVYLSELPAAALSDVSEDSMALLQRALTTYYTGAGYGEPLRFTIDQGRFALMVETLDSQNAALMQEAQKSSGHWLLVLAAACFVIGIFGSQMLDIKQSPHPEDKWAEREAHLVGLPDMSGLNAREIMEQAFPVMLPFVDYPGQKRAAEMFRHAVHIEPLNADAHASFAISMISLAILTMGGGQSRAYLLEADKGLSIARALAPESARVLMAQGMRQMLGDDWNAGWVLAEQAYAAAPDDPFISYFYGFVGFYNGRFEQVAIATNPDTHGFTGEVLSAHRLHYGLAQFFLENYADVIKALEWDIAERSDVSVFDFAFAAAAHEKLGNHERASELIGLMRERYPDLRPNLTLSGRYTLRPSFIGPFVEAFAAAGWDFEE
ncbi:hypothetical protein J7382_02940 [Shimia sp. R11_0]|uniref:hypothetical protein n=1 Tax=Shimia sp. R11_0 TaxID=2821096 RepID=UPI001ADD1A3D|nr:hypothetical protein [Shimia sp. R11_0]MBO9476482.1 hypothetical protein [Shimia sp. R11_0]